MEKLPAQRKGTEHQEKFAPGWKRKFATILECESVPVERGVKGLRKFREGTYVNADPKHNRYVFEGTSVDGAEKCFFFVPVEEIPD